MILVRSDFEKVHIISFRDVETGFLDGMVNLFRDHDTTILCRTDNVVDETADIVTFVEIETHISILSCSAAELRGIRPGGNKKNMQWFVIKNDGTGASENYFQNSATRIVQAAVESTPKENAGVTQELLQSLDDQK